MTSPAQGNDPPPPRWLAGNAKDSALFGRARDCAVRIGAARGSKTLWTGNMILFCGFAAFGGAEGTALPSACAGMAGLSAALGWLGERRAMGAVREMAEALDAIESPARAFAPGARSGEPTPTSQTALTLAALAKIQELKKLPKARGPR